MEENVSVLAVCPREFECNGSLASFDLGFVSSYLAIVSSFFSCLGAMLIIAAYFILKDMRTGAQKIITLLAVSNFVTASGYIVGSINFLTHFNGKDAEFCNVFEIICEIQSAITSWSCLSSFVWTVILAFHFYKVIVHNRTALAVKWLPLYNVVAWGVPLLIITPMAALRQFGFSPYGASNWCFAKDDSYYSSDLSHHGDTIVVGLIACKLWEILSYITVSAIYIQLHRHVSKANKYRQLSEQQPASRCGRVEKRLLVIPLLFVFLRMWGTLQFFYALAVVHYNQNGCIPKGVHTGFAVLSAFQAIGNAGQGWANAILYVFLSPTIRYRLFCRPYESCYRMVWSEHSELNSVNTVSVMSIEHLNRNTSAEDDEDDAAAEGRSITVAVGYKIAKYSSDMTTSMELTGSQMINCVSSQFTTKSNHDN